MLNAIFKFCQWSWDPLPYKCSGTSSRTALNLVETSTKLTARAFQIAVVVNYLSFLLKALKVTKEATEAYRILGLVVLNSTHAVLATAAVLVAIKIVAMIMSRVIAKEPKDLVASSSSVSSSASSSAACERCKAADKPAEAERKAPAKEESNETSEGVSKPPAKK
jgi:hypothetical protein